MSIYVMADIHGCYSQFKQMLDKIQFSSSDRLIILGDVIDREPHGLKIINYIIKNKNIEMIMGDHELMMLNSINDCDYKLHDNSRDVTVWLGNSGRCTYMKYLDYCYQTKAKIFMYLKKLPLYKIIDKFILVHAGVRILDYNISDIEAFMANQSEESLLWIRNDFYANKAIDGYTVVFGHTPTWYLDGDYKIWFDKEHNDKIGIDCHCCSKGLLGCLRLDDMKEYYY